MEGFSEPWQLMIRTYGPVQLAGGVRGVLKGFLLSGPGSPLPLPHRLHYACDLSVYTVDMCAPHGDTAY